MAENGGGKLPATLHNLNGSGQLTSTSLKLPPGLTPKRWTEIAERISPVGTSYRWWIGDLAQYARHHFEEPEKHLLELVSSTDSSMKYVTFLAEVAKWYPVRERVAGVSVSHHIWVRNLPSGKRYRLLMQAKEHKWSIARMLDQITPKKDRRIKIIIGVPELTARRTAFQDDLARLAKKWEFKYHVIGTQRQQTRRKRLTIAGNVVG